MISIAIIEDHLVLVEALELLLSSEGDFSIAGSADNLSNGREMLQHIRPDVLLLDVGFNPHCPGQNA
jgi:DNA-binding NarL/FixJ family response regulator